VYPKVLTFRIFFICTYAILALARVGVTILSPTSDSVFRKDSVFRGQAVSENVVRSRSSEIELLITHEAAVINNIIISNGTIQRTGGSPSRNERNE